jgi:altronate dehydratase large subunit
MPASVCASPLAAKLAARDEEIIALTHNAGCCQIGGDFERTTRVLTSLCTHRNVGGIIFIALGCEGTPSDEVVNQIRASGRPVRFIHIQDEGGSPKALKKALDAADALKKIVKETTERREAEVEDLVVGLECGGSDATSGLSANPAIGWVTDELVKYGAKVILSETTELIGAEHVITKNVKELDVKRKILEAVHRVESECLRSGEDIRGSQPTPGNIAGGLSTIEEKSMGCVYKSGSSQFVDFLEYGEAVRKPGLSFMDTPGQDVESMTGMAAGGASLFLFSTGRGSPVGFPIVPTIKITGNERVYNKMKDDIDIDASGIFSGKSIHQIGEDIYALISNVCNGEVTKTEINDYSTISIHKESLTL